MMKKNKFSILVLLILVIVAGYYFLSKTNSTLNKEFKDFAIKDTLSIDKIFITDYTGDKVTLTRGDNYWVVNGAHKARPECIQELMTTFSTIDVKSPVSKASFNNIVREIATKSIKVEIYQGKDTPSKVYYIGNPTQNNLGTYMVLENNGVKSSVPFIMHIPGFRGYLTTRFFANPLQWRDAAIFTYQPEEIKSVEVTYHEKPEESFKIEKTLNKISFLDGQTSKLLTNVDTNRVNQYLGLFGKIYYEMIVLDELKPNQQDSVRNTSPIFTIKLMDIYGKSTKIVALHMRNYKKVEDESGKEYIYDVDRMYGILNDDVLVYIQFYTFDNVTFPKQVFLTN